MANKKNETGTKPNTTRPVQQVTQSEAQQRDEKIVLPLVEEQLAVEKKWVKAGEVIVRREVETQDQTIPVDLAYEEVSVQRIPVGQIFDEEHRPRQRQEGDTLIIPVIEEQLVVLKRYLVREEIRITRKRTMRHEDVKGTVRREHLTVETQGNLEANND
ncbi:MAG: YsnF/AvaK domain-containing protein [Chloroflexota bacterium]